MMLRLISLLTTSILDTDERRRFAQMSHEYLIEQVQVIGSSQTTGTPTSEHSKLKIKFSIIPAKN